MVNIEVQMDRAYVYHTWRKLHFYKKDQMFFDICNAEMAQWSQKSWNLDIQSFYVKNHLNIFFFERSSVVHVLKLQIKTWIALRGKITMQ